MSSIVGQKIREDDRKPKKSRIMGMVGVGSGWMQVRQSPVSAYCIYVCMRCVCVYMCV